MDKPVAAASPTALGPCEFSLFSLDDDNDLELRTCGQPATTFYEYRRAPIRTKYPLPKGQNVCERHERSWRAIELHGESRSALLDGVRRWGRGDLSDADLRQLAFDDARAIGLRRKLDPNPGWDE